MRTQVYLTFYDAGGRCLVFRKAAFARFRGRLIGNTRVNGASKWCFPGGRWEEPKKEGQRRETYFEAAKREFTEETGITLPADLAATNSVSGTEGHYTYIGYAVRVRQGELDNLCDQIHEQLQEANALHLNRTDVVDNELEEVELEFIENLNSDYFTAGDIDTGWFYDLVERGLFL